MIINPPISLMNTPSWRAKAFLAALSQAESNEKEWVQEAAAKLTKQDWEQSVFSLSEVNEIHPKSMAMKLLLKRLIPVDLNINAGLAISANLTQWTTWFLMASQGDKWKLTKHIKSLEEISILKVKDSPQTIYLTGEDSLPLFDKTVPRTSPYVLWQWSWGGDIRDNDPPPTNLIAQSMISTIFKANRKANSINIHKPKLSFLQDMSTLKRYWSAIPKYEALNLMLEACQETFRLAEAFSRDVKTHKNKGVAKQNSALDEQISRIKGFCHQRSASNLAKMVKGDSLAEKNLALECCLYQSDCEKFINAGLLPIEDSLHFMLYPELKGKGFVSVFNLLFNDKCYQKTFLDRFSDDDIKIVLQRWLEETAYTKIIEFLDAHKTRLTPDILSAETKEKTTPLFSILKNKLAQPEKMRVLRAFLEAGADPTVKLDRGNIIDYAERFSSHSVYLPLFKEFALRRIAGEEVQNKPKAKI